MTTKLLAAIAAAAAVLAAPIGGFALADGMPEAAARTKAVGHQPRAHATAVYVRGPWPGGPDPYAYSYRRPGYYPYYNSNYWVPRREMLGRSRYPMRLPEYASSWGYPLGCKLHGRRNCGVPFAKKPGDPSHYYRRDVQLPVRTGHN